MTNRFAEPMARLIEELRKLPGIGTKSAQRLAFHVLRSPAEDAEALAVAIRELKQHLRNQRLVCVVEEPTNIATIEKTRSYGGVYHVLHGTLSPIGGVGPEQLRIANLLTRLDEVDEVILATSPTTEGEATAGYLAQELRKINSAVKVTRIATGVPAGSDIEYADEVTMTRAMEGRREF